MTIPRDQWPSTFGTNGYGCVGHREHCVPVPCPRNAIVKEYGGKCPACKAAQVAANRAAFARFKAIGESWPH